MRAQRRLWWNLLKLFEATVEIAYGERRADGKRLMSLLQLGVRQGDRIRILTTGRDAQLAITALQTAFEQGLSEAADTADSADPR